MNHPNLLVILSDQLRRHALSCYGETNLQTPHIDALAQRGVRCDHNCSTYPICVPYRFTLMTGQAAHSRMVPGIEYRMSPAERTLADEFNDAGYHTIYVGKWHLDGGLGRQPFKSAAQMARSYVPRARQGRWNRWLGFELRNEPYDTWYFVNEDPTPRKVNGYQTDGLTDLALAEIAAHRARQPEQPFCCVLSVEPPHPPFIAPPELEKKWLSRELTLPPNFMAKDEAERQSSITKRQRYYAMVENLDQNVGRITAFLEQQGLSDNTIVVFMADHGEFSGAHGQHEKQQPYEESVGVPLIVYDPTQPGRSGAVVSDPLCTEDLYPTLLGLAGLPGRTDLPGLDVAPLLRGQQERLPRDGVLLEFVLENRPRMIYHNETWRAWRTGTHKYVTLGNYVQGAKPWLCFDLAHDPWELHNLLEDPTQQAVCADLHRALHTALSNTDDDYHLAAAFGCPALNSWSA